MRFTGVGLVVAAAMAASVEAKTGKPRVIPSVALPALSTTFDVPTGDLWCMENKTQCVDLAYHKVSKLPLVAAAVKDSLVVSALKDEKFVSNTTVVEGLEPVSFEMLALPSGTVKMVVMAPTNELSVYSQPAVGDAWTEDGTVATGSKRFSAVADGENVFIAYETATGTQMIVESTDLATSVRSFPALAASGAIKLGVPAAGDLVAAFTPNDRTAPVQVFMSKAGNAFGAEPTLLPEVEAAAIGSWYGEAALTYVREGRLEVLVHDGKLIEGKWSPTVRSVNLLDRLNGDANNQVAFLQNPSVDAMMLVYRDYAGYSVDFIPNKKENTFSPKKRGKTSDIASSNGMLLRDVTALGAVEVATTVQSEGSWLAVLSSGKKKNSVTIHKVMGTEFEFEEHDEPSRGVKVFIATICVLAVVALVLYVYRPKKASVAGEDVEEALTTGKDAL